VGDNLGSLNRLILHMLFNSFLRNIFNFRYVNVLRNILSYVFDLLIVGIGSLNRLVVSLLNGLILGHSSGDWDVFDSLLRDMFHILSFVGHLVLCDYWFVVGVCFLDRDVLNV
jgi:hypothetical protein